MSTLRILTANSRRKAHFNTSCRKEVWSEWRSVWNSLPDALVWTSFRVTNFRISWSVGQLFAGRGIGGKAHVFRKTSAAFGVMERCVMRRWMMCVVVCICYVCRCVYGCVGCCFCKVLSLWLRWGCVKLIRRLLADVWWWAVVLVNKNPAWRSWTGRLIEVLTFNIYDMLSVNAIYVHAVKQPMYCRKEYKNLSTFSECPVKRMVEGAVDK
jgi:hypothetical protein